MKRMIMALYIIFIICLIRIGNLQAQLHWDMASAGDVGKILIERERAKVYNKILRSALRKAGAEGIKPMIYTHPIGIHGHGSGMMVGMVEK